MIKRTMLSENIVFVIMNFKEKEKTELLNKIIFSIKGYI